MNLGTLVLGLLNVLTVGLLAVGLVLVYSSHRFLNLAALACTANYPCALLAQLPCSIKIDTEIVNSN